MSLFGIKEKEEIGILNKEMTRLKGEVENLEKIMDSYRLEKENFDKLIEEKNEKILELETKLKSPFDKQFKKVISEFDALTIKNKAIISSNQELSDKNFSLEGELAEIKPLLERAEKDIESLKEKNLKLIKENKSLEDKIIECKSLVETIKIENGFLRPSTKNTFDSTKVKYKLLIDDLYGARKFDAFRKFCKDSGYVYVSELKDFQFDQDVEKIEGLSFHKMKNAEAEYLKFVDMDFEPEVQKYLTHGHYASKIFFRYRSFVSYLKSLNITYISEMELLDFSKLEVEGFTSAQIEKLKAKFDEYNEVRKI